MAMPWLMRILLAEETARLPTHEVRDGLLFAQCLRPEQGSTSAMHAAESAGPQADTDPV